MKDYSKSLHYFQMCLEMFQQCSPEKHSNRAMTLSNIGDVHRLMRDYEKAVTLHKQALNIQENIEGSALDCATTYANLAETYRETQYHSEALKYYEKGLKIFEEKLPKNHPDFCLIYHGLSKLYLANGQYAWAMKYIQQTISIAERKLSSTHPYLLEYRKTYEKIKTKD